jgi:SnoaL-like domain
VDDAIVQRLVDRLDIEDTLTRYATTIDAGEFDGLRTCFTDDARARYGAESEWLEGGDAIVAWIKGATEDLDWQHHMVSVYGVDIEGDAATALMYLLSHQTVIGVPDETRMMTSKYRNTLRRTGGGWRMSELDLEVGWYEERSNVKEKELTT